MKRVLVSTIMWLVQTTVLAVAMWALWRDGFSADLGIAKPAFATFWYLSLPFGMVAESIYDVRDEIKRLLQ